jgi:hypothetical protein
MKKRVDTGFWVLVSAAALTTVWIAVAGGAGPLADDAAVDGKELFLAQKCNMCHAVPAAQIEAKAKAASMKGPDLPTERTDGDEDVAMLIDFIRKNSQLDGKDHKKAAKATDEELTAIIAWLRSVKES